MAFVQRNQQAAQTNNNFVKAKGFINLYIASKTGGKKKLAGIALRTGDGYQNEQQLLEWLLANPENIDKLKEKLIVEFNPVQESGFDLE